MVDGATEAKDLDTTESNRETVRAFIDEVLVNRQLDSLAHCTEPYPVPHRMQTGR